MQNMPGCAAPDAIRDIGAKSTPAPATFQPAPVSSFAGNPPSNHNLSLPRRTKVLIAEDDPTVREYCVLALLSAGLDVEVAVDGLEAWELYQRGGCDLVITDNDMPGLTGLDLIKRIRNGDQNTPVLIISGTNTAAQECAELGVVKWRFLPKPFTLDRLIASVTESSRA